MIIENFYQVAINFMTRDGWKYDDAKCEIDNALNQITAEELTGSDWKPYARVKRNGLNPMNRNEKKELQLLFQSAANHSSFAIQFEPKVAELPDYEQAILSQWDSRFGAHYA